MARLTLNLLGLELDVTFGIAGVEAEDEGPRDLGYTTSTPVGFVVRHDVPDEATIHHQCSPYEDDSEAVGRG